MAESEAERRQRDNVIERALALPERDMHEVHRVLGEYLGAEGQRESDTNRQRRLRAEALAALRAAAEHLKLPEGRAPTIAEYSRAAAELGLTLSSQQVVRRWRMWREAQRALVGEHTQRTPNSPSSAPRPPHRRSCRGPVAGLREWLKTTPSDESSDGDVRRTPPWWPRPSRRRHELRGRLRKTAVRPAASRPVSNQSSVVMASCASA